MSTPVGVPQGISDSLAPSSALETGPLTSLGREVVVDAHGCDPALLRSVDTLKRLFDRVIDELDLRPVDQCWHQFPEPGGVTGMVLLSESHLTVHTFPEHGTATFNLYCCRPRPDWPWAARLQETIGAVSADVRTFSRG